MENRIAVTVGVNCNVLMIKKEGKIKQREDILGKGSEKKTRKRNSRFLG